VITIKISGGAFTIKRRSDGKFILSYGNILIAAENTYQAAFNKIFSGTTGVKPWDNLANKSELYQIIGDVSVEEEA
jgi:hypothetical protein